jgi:glucose/arabinose dehydrogenase
MMFRANAALAVAVSLFCGPQRDAAVSSSTDSAAADFTATSTTASQSIAPRVSIAMQEIVSGLDQPVYLTAPAGDVRLFIVEQAGRIMLVKNGTLSPRPFLDIRDKVGAGGERGLLSVALHPLYRTNGFLFVHYTDKHGDSNIERYKVSRDPDAADPSSAKLILKIDQPYGNHNGGMNLFGPDGMLYIGMGDGGSEYDPHGNGQNNNLLLSKLLRINVDKGEPYSIPSANPFVKGGGRGEIWATGLRNPWRFAFDAKDGNLYIADVGQDKFEEVDVVPINRPGVNYGWSVMEGFHCLRGSTCDQTGLQLPALEYTHSDGCSITGGFVYRGSKIPALDGHYFYADYCSSWLRSFKYVNGQVTEKTEWPVAKLPAIASFGLDGAGELYAVSHQGKIYKMVAAPSTGR